MSTRQMRRARERRAESTRKRAGLAAGRTKAVAGSGAALGVALMFAPAADAATFTVTSLADDGSEGTLREQIEDANAQGGDDVIVFQSGLSGTITLAGGSTYFDDIDIYDDGLEIQGPGAGQITVDGDDSYRPFEIYSMDSDNEAVLISGLTLTNGSSGSGGAISNNDFGGNAADLTIADSTLSGNQATLTNGGAILHESASLTITNTVISGNSADNTGGGVFLGGGGGDVLIADTTISDNEASNGSGGGVFVDNPAVPLDSLTIDRSTIARNRADEDGGGVNAWKTEGPVTVQNTTISGNEAGLRGGAIYFYSNLPSTRTVRSSTVVDNSAADEGGGVYVFQAGGGGFDEGDTINLSSTIISGNSATAEPDLGQTPPFDTQPEAFDVGFSLIEDPTDATISESPAGSNIFGVDPQLGALAANGGPTQTHLPAETSPVIDKGIASGLVSDQRGLARTGDVSAIPNTAGGDGTDIGAVELQAAACKGASVFSITGTAGNDTLTGDGASNAIFGAAGDDALSGADGNDCLFGEDGNDTATGGAGDDELSGGAGSDNLTGEAGKDRLRGEVGKDKLKGSGGKDQLKGDAGKDNLKGGGGKDRLNGGAGKDKLSGGGGKDRLKGGPGKDVLRGGGGKDRINCGGGKDKVVASAKDKVSRNCEKVVEKG